MTDAEDIAELARFIRSDGGLQPLPGGAGSAIRVNALESVMAFEVFDRKHVRAAGTPTVTVTARGFLSLNPAAYQVLGEPEFVNLLWSEDQGAVGLRPCPRDDVNAYSVQRQNLVSAMAFTAQNKIPRSQRYPAALTDDFLVFRANAGAAVTSNRAKN